MAIEELFSISDEQVRELLALMNELNSEIYVDATMLRRVAASASSHLFVMKNEGGRIIGTATLCVFDSPTGKKAHVEDVVVLSTYRGQGFGRVLMEHLIDFARKELVNVDIQLTSRPYRVAANEMYKAMGFKQKETNVYKMEIKHHTSD